MKKAGIAKDPSKPPAFSFRLQQSGESDATYKMLKARAKAKFKAKSGRAKAVKGLMQERGTHVPAVEPPGGADEPVPE